MERNALLAPVAIGEFGLNFFLGGGWRCRFRPIADLAEYEIDVWKPLLKAPFSTKEPDPMLRIARSVLNA